MNRTIALIHRLIKNANSIEYSRVKTVIFETPVDSMVRIVASIFFIVIFIGSAQAQKAQETFGKKDIEKKRLKKRQEKEEKMEARKANPSPSGPGSTPPHRRPRACPAGSFHPGARQS